MEMKDQTVQSMTLHLMENRKAYGYTTWGCMWEKGAVSKDASFNVYAKDSTKNKIVPSQSRITAYWPDGSVKWTAHTADSKNGETFEVIPVNEDVSSKKDMEPSLFVKEEEDAYIVDAGCVHAAVPKNKNVILRDVTVDGRVQVTDADLVLQLEERSVKDGVLIQKTVPYTGEIESVSIEEQGPVRVTFCLRGTHVSHANDRRVLPFVIRETIYFNSPKIDFEHTFLFDGDEKKDFLKGLGVRFHRPMKGEMYNRHIRFGTDHGSFYEEMTELLSWRPRVAPEIYDAQTKGQMLYLDADNDQAAATAIEASKHMPIWSRYVLCQDSATHFSIKKKIVNPDCCYIEGLHGMRAPGSVNIADESGSFSLSSKDFWQKYPSAVEAGDLDQDNAEVIFWLWCPQVEAMDFRHYADQGYSQTYYEGFDVVGASAYGIGNTNNFSIELSNNAASDGDALKRFSDSVQKPPVYVADPSVYEKLQAFGEWSLPSKKTQVERFLEEQLDKAFDFYKNEVEVRSWYGMFNYGDIMHTYDPFRHSWRYDMGGYAWQNTELVPTLWLWLAFMRSGREDIFTMAEAMSRHCSEVDIYHFGPLKGLGSRHNVRHWGCSCKEARIAMAGHHRFYYYLTGDMRLGDVFDDVKDADEAIVTTDPLRFFFDKDKMNAPAHARSGPDWSSFCSDWMTQWERFNDDTYRNKIQIGIDDLKALPLRLTSGPDFEYDPKDSHLRYIGERTNGGSHLQVCMGAIQVWIEIADLLGDEEWKDMLAEHGRFYYLPKEKQLEESNGLIGNREFSLPFMASGLAAYGAARLHDKWLAQTTWKILLHALCTHNNTEGFLAHDIFDVGNKEVLHEIPWITTNFTSQWCLNIITALRYIREDLPKTMEELEKLLAGLDESGFHKA